MSRDSPGRIYSLEIILYAVFLSYINSLYRSTRILRIEDQLHKMYVAHKTLKTMDIHSELNMF